MTQSISMAIWWRARSSSSSNAVPLVLDDAFAYARRRLPWPWHSSTVLLWTFGMFLQCDFDWTYMNLYILYIYIQLFMYTLMNVHKHFSKKNRFCSFPKVLSSSLISLRLATTAGFSSAAVLRGKGCAFGVRRPEASQAAHAASSTAKSRSAWHICCLLSLEMQAPSFHKSKKLTSSLQIKMPYHIIGIYWNEWLDIHEVLWWLPYFAQKEKKKAITAITCYYPAGLQSFPSQSPSLPNTNREYCSPGFNPKMQDEGRFVAPSASLLVERFECETVYACAQRSNDWHGSIPFVPFPAKMAWCGGKIVTQSTGN